MVVLNAVKRELTAKVVYYGPGLCGKTTNLKFIYENLDEGQRGKMLSLATEADRTLFFDFLPVEMGEVRGFKIRIQLYTVPGQVFYEETRKRVLRGADGVVFVADSQKSMWDANLESYRALRKNLTENGIPPESIPVVLQYNKRDLPSLSSVEELDGALNPGNLPFFEAMAHEGVGVEDTLRSVTKLVLKNLMSKELIGKTEAPPVTAEDRSVKERKISVNSTVVMDRSKLLSELGIMGNPGVSAKAAARAQDDPFGDAGPDDALLGAESPLALDVPSPPAARQEPEEVVFEEAPAEPLLLQTEETPPAPFEALSPGTAAPAGAPLRQGGGTGAGSSEPAAAGTPALTLAPGRALQVPVLVGGKRFLLHLRLEPAE